MSLSFIIQNPTGLPVSVADLGLVIEAGEERDLLDGGRFSTEQLALSPGLTPLLVAQTLNRLVEFGGVVIPASQAFDDATTEAHNSDLTAHGLQVSVLQNVTDAGSGNIINTAERSKLAGVEAGAEVNDTGSEIVFKLQGEATPLPLDVDTVDGANASQLRDRSTHTGTQTASTISDFDASADARIAAQKGQPNGLAELDGTGNIPAAQLGNVPPTYTPKGNWDAATNTPTLASGVGTNGDRYRVAVAGTTNLDGESDWQVGDEAYFAVGQWWKADNSDAVTSVNGLTGSVVLDTDDVGEGSNLYFTDARVAASPAVAANTAKVSADGSVATHSDVSIAGATTGQVLGFTSPTTLAPVDVAGESSQPVCQTRLGVAFPLTLGAWVTIPFNLRDEETDDASLSNPVANPETIVVVDADHPLQVTAWIPWSATSSDNFSIRLRINGTTTIPGTEATVTTFDDFDPLVVTTIVPAALINPGDVITVEMIENVGDVSVLAGATFQAVQLKGPRGEKGDTGSGSTIIVEDDGANVGIFDTIDFGERLLVVDNGGGNATINVESKQYLYLAKSANQDFSGSAVCLFDTEVRNTSGPDFTVNAVGGGTEITCNFDGFVEVTYDSSIDRSSGGRSDSLVQVERNGVAVPFSNRNGYHRQTSNGEDSMTCSNLPVAVANGDVLRILGTVLAGGGTLRFMANGCILKLERIY